MPLAKRKPRTIDEYLATTKPDQRRTLAKLRKTIHAVAPKVEECISYGIPAFRLNGRSLVFFGAWANHPDYVLQERFQVAGDDLDNGPSGFDLRQVQDIIDEAEQVLAAAVDDVEIPALLLRNARLAQQV